jgi:magnesium chelatase family protein
VEYETIKAAPIAAQGSSEMFIRVGHAVDIQQKRFGSIAWNAHMTPDQVDAFCALTSAAEQIVKKAFDSLNLSMRGYHKIIKVARTIADLCGSGDIDVPHIQEALMYRSLDKMLDRKGS